jgi:hypothetical protein
MTDLPAGLTPRLLTTHQLAAYLGYGDIGSIAKLIKTGLIPSPLPGTRKWDRHAIDAALDRHSGLTGRTHAVRTKGLDGVV